MVELLQEAVSQFGSLVEEVVLQRGEHPVIERPQTLFLAEERIIAKQAGQGVLGHHINVERLF